mmetsp:Transcript_19146/g.30965  ORF Transcript_19146/g.30965 Transcript_19146/m.30965 type:complete len:128 (-) Transcript_19146:18-401(-)
MKRSNQARKHRSNFDNTEEGRFDTPGGRERSNIGLTGFRGARPSVVKVGIDDDGKASVYVVATECGSPEVVNAPTRSAHSRSLVDYEAREIQSTHLAPRMSSAYNALTMAQLMLKAKQDVQMDDPKP